MAQTYLVVIFSYVFLVDVVRNALLTTTEELLHANQFVMDNSTFCLAVSFVITTMLGFLHAMMPFRPVRARQSSLVAVCGLDLVAYLVTRRAR